MYVYLHFNASINFPGVSRHLLICTVCCLTTCSASSSRRCWSSTGGGEDMPASLRSSSFAVAEMSRSGVLLKVNNEGMVRGHALRMSCIVVQREGVVGCTIERTRDVVSSSGARGSATLFATKIRHQLRHLFHMQRHDTHSRLDVVEIYKTK